MEKPIYALSGYAEWFWLLAKNIKPVENRDWKLPKKFIGERIYLHASKTPPTIGEKLFIMDNLTPEQLNEYKSTNFRLLRGNIIGEATITDCVTESDSPWFVGEYGFVLSDPVLYDKPIPCKGKLGFFKPELEVQK